MADKRLSKTQKDALFVLALMETQGKTGLVPFSRIRRLLEQTRPGILDPANFRKGMHTLAARGVIEVMRFRDLSLGMKLTGAGRHQAAAIYRARTGQQLDINPAPGTQVSLLELAS